MSRAKIALCWAVAAVLGSFAEGQNSTRKIRAKPSETAARAGSAVQWVADVETALAESKRRGAPVFWYVPTLAGSPMDRRPEIDRYMMAGPFSHPDVIALLNEGFVPVRAKGDREARDVHGLRPGDFVEPGFLVLAPDGQELLRAHKIVTLHPQWFVERLRPLAAAVPEPRKLPEAVQSLWFGYVQGAWDEALKVLAKANRQELSPAAAAEAGFLEGAILHRLGRHDDAVAAWKKVAARHPEEPWAWKAAAEAEGHGPFARGFEDFLEIDPKALRDHPSTTRAPRGVYSEIELRRRSLRFLTRMQDVSGEYSDSWYDFGGTDGLPNVFMAVTAIAGEALLEELASEDFPGDREDCEKALARILAHVSSEDGINRDDRDEIVWAHLYRVLLLARWLELRPDDEERVRPVLVRVVRHLEELQPKSGAWFHEYPNPFTTASSLVALHRAYRNGVQVDRQRIDLGVRALLRCRAENGGFTYGQARRAPRVSIPSAAGRMALCELGLSLWEKSSADKLEAAVRAGFAHHEQLENVRKYDDHAGPLRYGGFFFWYDMHGRTMAIGASADEDERSQLAEQQRAIIVSIAEFDGCFVDSHELGRVYGTASALLCLSMLRSM